MWPDLRKAGFHTHNSKTHFSPSNNSCTRWLTIQPGSYWCWKLPGLLLLWLVSEVCQTSTSSTSVQVAFKWLHIPLASRQPAVIHHTTGWWVWPSIYLTALCDMWRWKWHQWMPFGCFWWRRSLCPPLRGYPPTPTLQPCRSATDIGYTSKKLYKMVGNSASYSPNSWWIDRL